MGLIRMLFELILFYYVIKFIAKLFLPIVVKKVVKKAEENFQQQYQNQQQNQTNYKQKDGVIFDDSKVNKTKKSNNTVGEYVDFEEIE
jgi:Domain of unknown function (DUF4834)